MQFTQSTEVAQLKKSLESLGTRRKVYVFPQWLGTVAPDLITRWGQVKIDGEGAFALAQAKEEIEKMENYIDHLEGQVKQAVHEVERGEVQKIKANIRIKNLQFRHQEDMLRKHEEMSMRLRDSEQAPIHPDHRAAAHLNPECVCDNGFR